jgi:hypothetical protein
MAVPYPYPPYPPPQRKPFSTTDLVLTPLFGIGLLLGCAAGFVYSGFAVMATDGCGGTPDKCDYGLINGAYVVAWGAIALAILVALVGIVVSAVKRRTMFIWPLIGGVILVAGMVAGGFLLSAGVTA